MDHMSLELLSAHETADGIAITFVTERGLEPLEGTREEVAQLARVMQQVSVLAALNEDEKVWLEQVAVGDAIVRLGLNPGGQARVHIVRR
jgi:DNA-binding IclR family transcriptional regulator